VQFDFARAEPWRLEDFIAEMTAVIEWAKEHQERMRFFRLPQIATRQLYRARRTMLSLEISSREMAVR